MHKAGVDLRCDDEESTMRSWRRYEWNWGCDEDQPNRETINHVRFWDFTEDEQGDSHPTFGGGNVISDDRIREVVKFRKIREVIVDAKISDAALDLISRLPEIKAIQISAKGRLNSSHINLFAKANKLRTLKVWTESCAGPGVPYFRGLGKLTNLDCLEINYRFYDSPQLTRELCGELANLSRLKILRLDMGKMDYPPDFSSLKELGELQTFSTSMDDSGMVLPELATLPHLIELRLEPHAKMSVNFAAIAKLTTLESLTLDLWFFRGNSDMSFFGELSFVPRLRRLELERGECLTGAEFAGLSSTTLEELRVDYCFHFADQGLVNLAKGTNLKTLTLMNCLEISDEGIRALEKMTNLERLEIEYEGGPKPDGLTADGLRALKEKLPKCFISLRQYSKETGMSVDVVSLK